MSTESRTDVTIAKLAGRRHGVVTRRGLLAAGVTASEIRRRVARGTLIPVHRGVFRVGHAAPSVLAEYVAAVLACGDGAVLAGAAAAHLHRLVKEPPRIPVVITPTERRLTGVRTIHSRAITRNEKIVVRAVPVTTVPRTLVDLAGALAVEELTVVCHEAGIRHRTSPGHVEAVLRLHPKSPGIGNLRRVVHGEEKLTLSQLETRFLRVMRRSRLPLPVTNRVATVRLVDCRWPEHRLTVELDSFTFHNSRQSWQQSYHREREAYARGDQFRRYTWADVTEDSRAMLAELRDLLS